MPPQTALKMIIHMIKSLMPRTPMLCVDVSKGAPWK